MTHMPHYRPALAAAASFLIALVLGACASDRTSEAGAGADGPLPPGVEAISFLGDTLRSPELPAQV
ncbi:MAG: hypothetical protein R3253_12165, partial [Longimicrobiales bacterium]|nr:hypothetical protein [Longimicrobiales bacterium]